MKKLIVLIAVLVGLFTFYLIFVNLPKNYESKYSVDDFEVVERFHKKKNYYTFQISNTDYTFDFLVTEKYSKKRKLITEITLFAENNEACLIAKARDFALYPMCYQDEVLVSPENVEIEDFQDAIKNTTKTNLREYGKLKIYDPLDEVIVLWNYRGIDTISNSNATSLELFNEDIYNPSLIETINDYLFVPDYSQDYAFDKAYIIEISKNTKSEWKLDNAVSFDSYILGKVDKSIYLFDTKEKKEYEFVPHKKRMRTVSKNSVGTIFSQGKFEDITTSKLATDKPTFEYDKAYSFVVKSAKLYVEYNDTSIYIKDFENGKIIKTNNSSVYYLINDKLYEYSLYTGEKLLIENFEWNFNNSNMVYIIN